MTTLRPYPEYKTARVDWLGSIPKHWIASPNRALFREVIDKNRPSEQLLSVTIGRGVITQRMLLGDSTKKDQSNEDKSAYKLVEPDDLAYNKMRAWQGAIGVSEHHGIVSPAYIIMRPIMGQHPRFLHYLFRTPAFATEAERWSYGITSDQWSLRSKDFACIYSLLPPFEEQRAIADFLGVMDARISRFIAARRKMITLLKEQMQAVINQAVTRGLDPDVSMKPSGVEWLGDIPEHWRIAKLKHHVGFQEGPGIMAADFRDEGTPLLRISCL
jgi:type I restriction enzyme S subunit